MEIINLNLIPTGTRPVVHASQYDNGRQFRANLFEGASVYTLTGAETLTFSVRKPDGHIVTEAVTNTSDNYVIIETTTQMCACAGDSFAELKIENGADLIGTLNLILAVEQSPEEGGDPSESFIHNLEEQIAEAVADQYDADSVVFDANPTAGHGVGFAVTSEGVKNAIDGIAIPDELNDLSDVTTTTPASGEALIWDGTKWVNGTPTLDVDDLDDVTITTPTDGEILVYNNGTWENQANPASTTNFAPDYDDTATYNTNDKVIYQGLLYVCLEDSVTGAWDNTKWQQISVSDYTAELLPIASGSSTNTKDYIDTGLSGAKYKIGDTVTGIFDMSGFIGGNNLMYGLPEFKLPLDSAVTGANITVQNDNKITIYRVVGDVLLQSVISTSTINLANGLRFVFNFPNSTFGSSTLGTPVYIVCTLSVTFT